MDTNVETLDKFVHKSTTGSISIDTTNDALVKPLETLASGIKELTLATEKRLGSERVLSTAVYKLTASLDMAIQAQAHTSFNDVMNDCTYMTNFEDGSTPSTP